MSAPTSVEELIQLIRKSGMVEEAKLTGYIHRRQKGRGLSGDAREAADAMISDGILTNFQSEQFLLGKWRGFTIGKYKLLERIGVGGMGQVFLCEHMFMKRRVAIKVLPPAKAEQPAALGRFYREARAAGSLEHANIVRTHDIDQDGNLHFIIMEYVDGSNLLEIVKKFGPMAIPRAVSYTRQVAAALDFAFKSGIIHRDVKPGNILIDRKGLARILDMGLARFFKDQTDLLTVKYDDKIVLGTADYVAPEQVANSHSVDVRADIYALGATLYFLLAGHPPFPSGTVSQKLLWHRTKEPTAIRQIRPEIPEELAAVLAKMMAKDPAARYQTPADVVNALQVWSATKTIIPPLAEMPQLCPAVLEGMDAVPEVEPLDLEAAPPEPLAVGAGYAHQRGIHAETRPQPAKPFGSPPNPFASPAPPMQLSSTPNPFAVPAASRAKPPAQNPMATPYRNNSRFDSGPATSPVGPYIPEAMRASDMPPGKASAFGSRIPPATNAYQHNRRTEQPLGYKLAMYTLLTASILVGGSLVYWKFFKKSLQPNTPAITATTTQ